jgi:hypothetical protein
LNRADGQLHEQGLPDETRAKREEIARRLAEALAVHGANLEKEQVRLAMGEGVQDGVDRELVGPGVTLAGFGEPLGEREVAGDIFGLVAGALLGSQALGMALLGGGLAVCIGCPYRRR